MLDTRPFRSSAFRHLATGYWVNYLGDWIGEVALAVLVFDRTGSALATATLFLALRVLPALVAPLLAVFAEARSPRRVLPSIYLMEGVIFAAIALLAPRSAIPAVMVLAALDGMLSVTARALTRSAAATGLLAENLLREGNALLSLGSVICGAAGPALGGLLVAAEGVRPALLVDAVSFVLVAGIVATASGLRIAHDKEAGTVGRLRAVRDVVRWNRAVAGLLLGVAFVFLLGAIPIPVDVVFAKRTLHAGDVGYGLLLAAWGVGMTVGGVAFAATAKVRPLILLCVSTLLLGAGYGGLAVAPNLVFACAVSVIAGAGNGVGWTAAVTAVQQAIPVTTMSGVMSVLETVSQVMPAAGFMIGGALTALYSPRAAYGAAGAGVAAVVLVGLASRRRVLRRNDGIVLRPPANNAL